MNSFAEELQRVLEVYFGSSIAPKVLKSNPLLIMTGMETRQYWVVFENDQGNNSDQHGEILHFRSGTRLILEHPYSLEIIFSDDLIQLFKEHRHDYRTKAPEKGV